MKNKLISPALLYDDRKNIIASAGTIIVILIISSIGYIINPNGFISAENSLTNEAHHVTKFLKLNMDVLSFIPLVAVITSLSFYSSKENQYCYLRSQPIKKDSFIITKTFGVVISYTVPLLFYIILASGIIAATTAFPNTIKLAAYKYLFTHIVLYFIFATLLVLLVQFLQMIFVNNIAALAMSMLVALCVFFELAYIYFTSSPKLYFIQTALSYLYTKLIGTYKHPGILGTLPNFLENHLPLAVLSTLLIAALLFFFTILLNRKVKCENFSGMFIFKTPKILYKVILSTLFVISIELILTLIFILFFNSVFSVSIYDYLNNLAENHIWLQVEEYLLLAVNLALVPFTALMYKFISFIEKKTQAL